MLFTPARFTALLALTTAVLAAPSPSPLEVGHEIILPKRDCMTKDDSDEIDFKKVSKHLGHVKGKYHANMDAFHHNTGHFHPLDKREKSKKSKKASKAKSSSNKKTADSALSKTTTKATTGGTGTVSLANTQQAIWYGPITFGGQTFNIDFDTGSADIIVNRDAYTPGSTATNTGNSFYTAYGDGTTASGTVYTDNLSVGGLTASKVGIGRSNNNFIDTASEGDSGIAGMSFPALSQTGQAPFFDALRNQKKLAAGVFTFKITPSTSSLFLGGIAPNSGTLTYVSVDSSQGFWSTAGSINGRSTAGIQDTGTTLIVAPTSYARSLFSSMSGVQTFSQDGVLYGAYNCNSAPTITVKFGKFSRNLSAPTKTIGKTNDGRCVLSIVGQDIGINSVIFGDYWYRNVVAVFDRDNTRMGFAPKQ